MDAGIRQLCASVDVNLHGVIDALHREILKEKHVTADSILANLTRYKLLEQTAACVPDQDTTVKSSDLQRLLENVITEVCLPALEAFEPSYDGREIVMMGVLSVCDLLSVCHAKTGGALGSEILTICLKSLKFYHSENLGHSNTQRNKIQYSADCDHRKHLDIYCVIEVLRSLLSGNQMICDREEEEMGLLWDDMYSTVLSDLELCSSKLSSRLVSAVISKMLKRCPEKCSSRMKDLWNTLKDISQLSVDSLDKNIEIKHQRDVELPLMILCSLADFFFPEDGNPAGGTDIREDPHLWLLVQRGLSHNSSEARKRSLYLLKRILDICECTQVELNTDDVTLPQEKARRFWWSGTSQSRLSKVWEDYLLLIEMLEEKQTHIIKPALPRFQNLLTAATPDTNGVWLLHSSWLVTIIARSFLHECSFIARWAACTVLSINYQSVPLLHQGQDTFLAGTLLYRLQDLKLYTRPQGAALGSCSPSASALLKFFTNVFAAMATKQQKKAFMHRLLRTIISTTWGSIPLMYIFQSLASIPPTPILDAQALTDIREIVITNFSTLELFTRGAVLCFLTQMIIHLVDRDEASLTDLAKTLCLLDRNESLQRGTTLWGECVTWLGGVWTEVADTHSWSLPQFQLSLSNMSSEYLKKQMVPDTFASSEVTALARLLMLACDAGLYERDGAGDGDAGSQALRDLLAPSSATLSQINSHAYMSPVLADRALNLLSVLALERGKGKKSSKIDEAVRYSMKCCWSEIISYIQRRVTEDIKEVEDLGLVELYRAALRLLAPLMPPHAAMAELFRLASTCISCLKHINKLTKKLLSEQLTRVAAMTMLGAVSELLQQGTLEAREVADQLCDYAEEMKLELNFTAQTELEDSVPSPSLGRVVSQFMCQQWRLLHFLFVRRPLEGKAGRLLPVSLEALSISAGEADDAILACVTTAIPQLLKPEYAGDVVQVLEASWNKALEDVKVNAFWSKLETCVALAVQPEMLQTSLVDVRNCVTRLMTEIYEMGADRSGVVNVLVSHLCQVFAGPGGAGIALEYVQIVADACMFGTIHKKMERLWLDTCAYVESLDSACSINELMPSISKADNLVRMTVVQFLLQLHPSNPDHRALVSALMQELTARYHLVSDQREFVNSLLHRQRNRILQTLLILEPFIAEEDVDPVWEFLWKALAFEHHQSVRFMLEWMVLRMVLRLPPLLDRLFRLFDEFEEKRTVCLCSLFLIVSHLGPKLPAAKRADFYQSLLVRVVPWCLANHYNTRLYALVALSKAWDQCHALHLSDVISANPLVGTCVKFGTENRSATKNVPKMLSAFFLRHFDFQRDYSLETIFHTLLDLCGMSNEEWIPARVFSHPSWQTSHQPLPTLNPSSELSQASRTVWRLRINDDEGEEQGSPEGDVQKKIMPWRYMVPESSDGGDLELSTRKLEAKSGGLILVTSLIDKIPNLGGLCRTSEIFGVSEYVIRNLKFVEDRVFQSLSVTAHKWVPITEVVPFRLPEYLEEKRCAGFTLVGVEQTANSVCLTQFNFPENTLLLLGNEKEGIPANLLPYLDVCVEIPQEGLIRSLNVHVSGAILVWEYRRQQLAKRS